MEQRRTENQNQRQASGDAGFVVPVTSSRREREDRSFWKRLTFRRHRRSPGAAVERPARQASSSGQEDVEARLAGLESAVNLASERLESRMLQFWEMEEQMGRVSRLVSELETSQRDLAERSQKLSRSIVLLSVVAALATGVALFLGVSPRG